MQGNRENDLDLPSLCIPQTEPQVLWRLLVYVKVRRDVKINEKRRLTIPIAKPIGVMQWVSTNHGDKGKCNDSGSKDGLS